MIGHDAEVPLDDKKWVGMTDEETRLRFAGLVSQPSAAIIPPRLHAGKLMMCLLSSNTFPRGLRLNAPFAYVEWWQRVACRSFLGCLVRVLTSPSLRLDDHGAISRRPKVIASLIKSRRSVSQWIVQEQEGRDVADLPLDA